MGSEGGVGGGGGSWCVEVCGVVWRIVERCGGVRGGWRGRVGSEKTGRQTGCALSEAFHFVSNRCMRGVLLGVDDARLLIGVYGWGATRSR